MPDPIKMIGAPVIRKKLVNNTTFLKQYEELSLLDSLTDQKIQEIQYEKLRMILIHAYKHTKYYRRVFDKVGFDPEKMQSIKELERIPLLTKKLIADNFNDLQADNVEDAYVGETGGSTGQPLKLLLSRDSIYKEKAYIYHFWSKYGYDYQSSKIVTFRGLEFNGKYSVMNPLYNEIVLNPFALNEKNIKAYIKKIEKFGADFIHGYPSAVSNFCRLMNKCGLRLNRKIVAVFLISETCTDLQKKNIEDTLKCPVAVFYGHTERAVFAEQCTQEIKYKFNPFYGYTEILKHEAGNIVCTGFLNDKFPLIRYAVDDEATLVEDGLFCIEGHHTNIVILGKNDERISQTALNFHDDTFSDVSGYQFYQERPGTAECRVQGSREFSEAELEKIRNGLFRKCGDSIKWEVKQVEKFELSKRGKFKIIIQKCGESQNE